MKLKHGVIIITAGICLQVIAALFKIQHWPMANLFLMISTVLQVTGLIIVVYKYIRDPKNRDMMNR